MIAKYDLKPGEYELLFLYQGGVCWICQRAKGISKRLAVDHDHVTGETRGLLCSPCNSMLAHVRDAVSMFSRAIDYLTDPPARAALNRNRYDSA